MNNLHHQKNQDRNYKVGEVERISNHKSLVGLKYVAEAKRGRVVSSVWFDEKLEDGSWFRLNQRVRVGLTPSGKEFRKVDHTLIVREIGVDLAASVGEEDQWMLNTSIGCVCLKCRTSDHVVEDGSGFHCTRCGGWIAKGK